MRRLLNVHGKCNENRSFSGCSELLKSVLSCFHKSQFFGDFLRTPMIITPSVNSDWVDPCSRHQAGAPLVFGQYWKKDQHLNRQPGRPWELCFDSVHVWLLCCSVTTQWTASPQRRLSPEEIVSTPRPKGLTKDKPEAMMLCGILLESYAIIWCLSFDSCLTPVLPQWIMEF